MDYLGVYLDQRTAISHHGTKGMRWGVWNDETRARYLGLSKRTPRTYGEGLRENINRLGLASGLADTKMFGKNRGYSRSELKNERARNLLNKRIIDTDTKMQDEVDEAQIRKAAKKQQRNDIDMTPSALTNMTTDELNAAVNRMAAEDRYIQITKARKEANKSFIRKMGDSVVSGLQTALIKEGANLAGKMINVQVSRIEKSINLEKQNNFFNKLDSAEFEQNSSPLARANAYSRAWAIEQKNPGLYDRILNSQKNVDRSSGSSKEAFERRGDESPARSRSGDQISEHLKKYRKAERESKRETRDFKRSYKYWTDDDFKKYGDEFQRKSQEDLNRWGSEFRNDSSTISSGSAFSQTYSDYDYTLVDDDSTTWSR